MNGYKVALISICLNQPYWQFYPPMVESAKKFLLKGHQVDFICWSDMPVENPLGVKVIPTEPFTWPLPTLYRFHLFLRQEELLKEYDYIFYCDADMKFVSRVGDEILGEGLTAAQHPMYAIKKEYVPPYEPNEKSEAFIPRPGRVIEENGKKRFEPLYFAGGFQGGRSEDFIAAMKEMKEMIDKDFTDNCYIPVWNDESIWNKYLFKNPPAVVLDVRYVYPDSLNSAYYQKIWGRNFCPKLITLTKQFSLSKDGGQALQGILKNV
jgi:hypothetical protein